MAAHPELEKVLSGKRLTYASGTPGITTITAPNTTLSMQDIQDLINSCLASGYDLVFTAGSLKIRPKDTAL